MTQVEEKNGSGLTYQFVAAIVLLIVGLLMLVTWIVLYENKKNNGFSIPWWIWFFLGFGLGLILIAIVWLIIISYAMSSRIHSQCEQLCELRKRKNLDALIEEEARNQFITSEKPKSLQIQMTDIPDEASPYMRSRSAQMFDPRR